MLISMRAEEKEALWTKLRAYEDAEESGDGSISVDLYEPDPAVALELYPEKEGISITAAAYLLYSEEMQGWYMGERIHDEDEQRTLLQRLRDTL